MFRLFPGRNLQSVEEQGEHLSLRRNLQLGENAFLVVAHGTRSDIEFPSGQLVRAASHRQPYDLEFTGCQQRAAEILEDVLQMFVKRSRLFVIGRQLSPRDPQNCFLVAITIGEMAESISMSAPEKGADLFERDRGI